MEDSKKEKLVEGCIPITFLGRHIGWANVEYPEEEFEKRLRKASAKPTRLQNLIFNFLCLFSKRLRKMRSEEEMER